MTPIKDYPDAQKEIEIVPVNAIPSVVVDYPDFQREVEVIAGSEGMAFEGAWLPELGYAKGAVVRYKGKAYVCINGILASPAPNLGLGPPAKGIGTTVYEYPEGIRVPPRAQIISGEPIEGELTSKSPSFRNENFLPFAGWRAAVYQLMLKEAEGDAVVTIGGFPEGALAKQRFGYRAYIGNDAGEQKVLTGNSAKAEASTEKLHTRMPGTTLVGGAYRFYVSVFGGQWEHTVAGKEVITSTIPMPYAFTLTSAAIQEAPGNPPPSTDVEHWALLAGA